MPGFRNSGWTIGGLVVHDNDGFQTTRRRDQGLQEAHASGPPALTESRGRNRMPSDQPGSLVWHERLQAATDAAGVALWSWDVDTDLIGLDDRAHELWGVQKGRQITFEDLSANIHPADIERVRRDITATKTIEGRYEIDFRISVSDETRWISARGQGADVGIVGRLMYGVFLDITSRKRAEEAREMLLGEMSHRIKNLFAVASALTAIAARSATTTTEMARDLTQRLTALGHAHDLVSPVAGQRDQRALLGELLVVLLAPYEDTATPGHRIRVTVPPTSVGESAATNLALIIHELATNSLKYGALSEPSGKIGITCTENNGDIVLAWTETDGPPVSAPTGPPGFGSKLVSQSMSGPLGGSIAFDWLPDGVIVTLRMSKSRLAG